MLYQRFFSSAFVLSSALWVGSATAIAQVDQTKTDKISVDVEEVARKKSGQQTKASLTKLTRNEAFLVATETRLRGEIIKAIRFLTRTFRQLPKKSPSRLQMQEKLMNLRLELAVYEANAEMRTYDRTWEQWDRNGRKGREPKLDSSKSNQQWQLLAQEAAQILRDYPRSKNADTVMFNIALSQNFLGKEKESAQTFSKLIAKYPNSQKAGDAYFALGDFFFDRADFRNASNNYKNALRFKRAKTYAYSLFKLGWCSYNLGQYKTAMSYWKATVGESKKGGKQGMALKEEAMRDLVYVFAELRQIEPAISYYKANGGEEYIGRFLLLLSNTFADQGAYSQAIKVLKRFQQVAPTDEEAPRTQKEIINLNFELGRMRNVWAELAAFPRLYGPSSRWASVHKQKNKQLYLETQKEIKDQILYYAKIVHKRSQADDNRSGYAEAMKGYRLFLRSYPRSKEVAEVKFNMADIEYFTKNYAAAGKLYFEICLMGKDKAVIYDAKSGKPRNIHKQSAEWMLESYSLLFDREYQSLIKQKPDYSKNKPPKPLTTNAKLFIKACGNYTKFYPNDKKEVMKCDVFITKIYYHTNNEKMAKKYLWILAKKYPGSPEGIDAVNSLIPLYEGNDKALVAAAEQILKIPAYQKGKLGNKLRLLVRDVGRKNIASMRDTCKRGDAYAAEYKKNQRDPEADKLIYNAAVDYLKCGKISDSMAAYTTVISKFPKSAGAQESLLQLAKLHEQRINLDTSANFYKTYYGKYTKDKFAVGALAKACELEAALESGSSVSTCLNFAKIDQASAKIAFNRMIRAAFSSRSSSRLSQLVRTYLSRFRISPAEKIEAYSYIYDLSNGNGGAASQAAREMLSTFQAAGGNIEGEPLASVGKIIFSRANGEMGKFLQYRLKGGTVDTLAASIQQKTAALQRLNAAYQDVLSTRDPYWGVAALYQMGFSFEELYKDLDNPPQIKGAPADAVKKELAPQAAEAKAGAEKFYGQALNLVVQAAVYNEWAAKVISGMNRIKGVPVEFDDIVVTPDFLGAEVPTSVASAVQEGGAR